MSYDPFRNEGESSAYPVYGFSVPVVSPPKSIWRTTWHTLCFIMGWSVTVVFGLCTVICAFFATVSVILIVFRGDGLFNMIVWFFLGGISAGLTSLGILVKGIGSGK